mmetsp:Transcript_32348/g.84988  ORF Transcript_32348/g.84988 Transcript_32348/m.84988 type:complete len:615 (-) Transcript_32348:140-1984(-)
MGAVNPGGNLPGPSAGIVSGTCRYKYFRRPIVPHIDAVSPDVLLAPTEEQDPTTAPVATAEPMTKEQSVQTQYRESEAQTNPYTPAYVVPAGERELEVEMLAGLSFENGLPVRQKEIDMIENARQKRALEAALPPVTDEASLNLRKKMMELQENREFNMRTAEMDQAHEDRLAVLRSAIAERDQGNEFLAEQRVEALRQRRVEQKDNALAVIQAKRIKILRKLTKARGNMLPAAAGAGGNTTKRDIIEEYARFCSKVYAPNTRTGQHPDKNPDKFDVTGKIMPLESIDNIKDLEETLPVRLSHSKVRKPLGIMEKKARSTQERKAMKLTMDLQKMSSILSEQKEEAGSALSPGKVELPAWRTRVSKAERPPTPTVESNPSDDVVNCLVLLQRLLRGRAVQNTMYEGKEKRKELIKELRAADELAAEESHEFEDKKEEVHLSSSDTVAGETVSNMLDFLSKELVRKEEKEKLQALSRHATDMRRSRETEESGKRQAEEKVRAREDEVYRQVVKAHYGSATSFVDAVMESSLDRIASGTAMDELRQNPELARALLDAAQATPRSTESLTRDLVASFLTPSAEEVKGKQAVAEQELRYVDAAHKTIDDTVEGVVRRE